MLLDASITPHDVDRTGLDAGLYPLEHDRDAGQYEEQTRRQSATDAVQHPADVRGQLLRLDVGWRGVINDTASVPPAWAARAGLRTSVTFGVSLVMTGMRVLALHQRTTISMYSGT